MSRTAATAGTDRLLHGSPQRTVFISTDKVTGQRHACKVLVSGSMADAEHEVAMGRLCRHAGVVRYIRFGTDATTNRPCVVTAFEEGKDLERMVAEQGALPAALACELLAPVAESLAMMHALQVADAPDGVCHGDVKPKNLLHTATTTLLLDFEHSRPIETTANTQREAHGPFTGGTCDFAPPEAARGAPPDGAFDVHGLGSTLRWLTTAGGIAELPQHPDFVALMTACLALDPAHRPAAARVAARLRALASQLAADPDETLLHEATDTGVRPATAKATPTTARPGLLRLWFRRQRLLRRVPHLLAVPDAHPTEPAALLREIRTATRVLTCFPRHQPAWRWRHELCLATGRLLVDAAAHVTMLRRAEEFDVAIQWLTDAKELALSALPLPGGCPIAYTGAPTAIGLLHRDPVAFLHQLSTQVDAARHELATDTQAILEAESRLDLDRAEQAIEGMAARYGGSSPAATRRRDQLHRLSFYLERIARAQANVERIGTLWDAVALKPLTDLVVSAAAACQRKTRSEGTSGVVGLRSLQITLVNLGEEFPHLSQTGPALEALSHALAHLTDQGWELMAEAQRCLGAVPVPVRPLQVALSRLDTYRILEALVDQPGRSRSQLQDELESLRLRLDEARATRDRLTEGAEHAMARGHWTTGLFDMERAVAELNPIDEGEQAEASRLKARLSEAKRRKQEVEGAVRRNVERATRYGTMQDDPSSSFTERLEVLAERRDCLHMLAVHAPAERAVLYRNDLREVETQMAIEQAAQAEHQIDGTVDPLIRLTVARETLDQLSASVSATPRGQEAPGRMLRLLDHWRTVTAHCQRAAEQMHNEERAEQQQRRRLWSVAAGAALASAGAIILAVWPWLTGGPANAASLSAPATGDELAARIATLPPHLHEAAKRLVVTAVAPSSPTTSFETNAWHARWGKELGEYAQQMAGAEAPAAARTFAIACWDSALAAAVFNLDAAGRRELERLTQALVDSLGDTGLRPTRR